MYGIYTSIMHDIFLFFVFSFSCSSVVIHFDLGMAALFRWLIFCCRMCIAVVLTWCLKYRLWIAVGCDCHCAGGVQWSMCVFSVGYAGQCIAGCESLCLSYDLWEWIAETIIKPSWFPMRPMSYWGGGPLDKGSRCCQDLCQAMEIYRNWWYPWYG